MLIALVVFCVLLEAIFTALEVALGATSRSRLRALTEVEKNAPPKQVALAQRAARTILILEDAPRTTLLFIAVTSLSLWTAASLLTWKSLMQQWPGWALPSALVGVLFVAEVLPVLIAAASPEAIALRGAPLMKLMSTLLAPLLWIIGGVGRGLSQLAGSGAQSTPQVTKDELRSALAAAEEEGAIESSERAFLEGAMDFRAKIVREVMTPRMDIKGVRADATLREVLEIAIEQGHSRLPVYEGTLDKVIGIASTKDLIPFLREGATHSKLARDIVRPAFYVPENKRIAATLDDLRQQRSLMAIVVDDGGATAGLVTLEDLLEEIVGDIQDETDQEEPPLVVLGDGVLQCSASTSVRDCEKFWEKSFRQSAALKDETGDDADDSQSLAALALHLFNGVPNVGDRVEVGVLENANATSNSSSSKTETPIPSLEMEVLEMSGPRIATVKIQLQEIDAGL